METGMLSDHFSLAEATESTTAVRLSIANAPDEEVLGHMELSAERMELVRDFLGGPIHVDSWYRCPELNKAVGGAADSAHMLGWAIDFTCPNFGTPEEIVGALEKWNITFDQLIQEGTWVHISFDPRLRQQVMTAHFVAGGRTTYTKGA